MSVFSANHHFDDFTVALIAGTVGRDVAAVAKYRALIRQLGDL